MLEASDIVVCLVIGLAAPLAILDSCRLMFDGLPEHGQNQALQRRALFWLFALIAGPALFWERVVAEIRSGGLRGGQLGLSAVAIVCWAWLYGLTLIGLLKQIHG
ncbi:hypothetical protein [Rhizobium sp. FKL33]|jgi:hypothetical protein|uniref:hypothetical protein n=1 Tax=Rhizobium sp. FKL33 TaxID=2562307 RepID=UPI0010C05387|nr:hypothetical protein [Rhizobium sp. FKL33]